MSVTAIPRTILPMYARMVEAMVRPGHRGPTCKIRIDLHGISTFGPGEHYTQIRWDQLTAITPDMHGVTITSPRIEMVIPRGAFGPEPIVLAEKLEAARSIFDRADVIAELSGAGQGASGWASQATAVSTRARPDHRRWTRR